MKKICGIILLSVCYLIMLVFVDEKIVDYIRRKDEKLHNLAIQNLMVAANQYHYSDTALFVVCDSLSGLSDLMFPGKEDFRIYRLYSESRNLDDFQCSTKVVNIFTLQNDCKSVKIEIAIPTMIAMYDSGSFINNLRFKFRLDQARECFLDENFSYAKYSTADPLARIEYTVPNEYYYFSTRAIDDSGAFYDAKDYVVFYKIYNCIGKLRCDYSKINEDRVVISVVVYGIIFLLTIGTIIMLKKRKRRGK